MGADLNAPLGPRPKWRRQAFVSAVASLVRAISLRDWHQSDKSFGLPLPARATLAAAAPELNFWSEPRHTLVGYGLALGAWPKTHHSASANAHS